MDWSLSGEDYGYAVDVVREAALLARAIQRELVSPALLKEDRSPVTVADYAVQAFVACRLHTRWPAERLIAEESVGALSGPARDQMLGEVAQFVRGSLPDATADQIAGWIDRGGAEPGERFWTLDPIDGTKGFIRDGQYAVALAWIEAGRVELGVLGCPKLDLNAPDLRGEGMLVAAVRGAGCWAMALGGTGGAVPLRVVAVADPARARVLRSVEAGHTNVERMDSVLNRLGVSAEPCLMDSQAKYAVLAAGRGDLLFRLLSARQPDYRERIWDQAAGSIIVEEAGGRITDLAGEALDFRQGRTLKANRGIVASNGLLHEAALAALRAAAA